MDGNYLIDGNPNNRLTILPLAKGKDFYWVTAEDSEWEGFANLSGNGYVGIFRCYSVGWEAVAGIHLGTVQDDQIVITGINIMGTEGFFTSLWIKDSETATSQDVDTQAE
jgi:hypothetical protein